jgi:hypothetical protein
LQVRLMSPSSRAVVASLITLATAGLMVGCGDADPAVLDGEGVRTFVQASKNGGDDAQITGLLTLTDNACLAVESPEGLLYVLVWPSGTTLLTGGRTGVDVPDAGAIEVGDSFEAGGGYYQPPLPDSAPAVPGECLAGAEREVALVDHSVRRI